MDRTQAGDPDRGIKAESPFGQRNVIVNRFRNTDDGKTASVELFGNGQRTFAAKNDKSFDTKNVEICQSLIDRHFRKNRFTVNHFDKTAAVACAEYRAAGWKNFDPKAPPYRPSQAEIDRMRANWPG